MKRRIFGRGGKTHGVAPAIVLINPKFPNNVGMVLRLASCWNIPQVWFTGTRVQIDIEARQRLPREERMRGYGDVDLLAHDYPFDRFPKDVVPVGVEVMDGAESLYDFEHPERAVYVFGPEDGGLTGVTKRHCHRFVQIPSRHCLNLATAVCTVLYDRSRKRGEGATPGEFEGRGWIDPDDRLGWQGALDDPEGNPTRSVRRT